jgi:hypothetical protein
MVSARRHSPGTANLMQPDGTVREGVPLQQGPNQLVVRRVLTGGNRVGLMGALLRRA